MNFYSFTVNKAINILKPTYKHSNRNQEAHAYCISNGS